MLLDNGYYLIDHELTLPINFRTIQNFENEVSIYDHKSHIFYKYLRTKRRDRKVRLFESFEEILRYVRPMTKLKACRDQLIKLNHPVGDFDSLAEYIALLKRKSPTFIRILRDQIL